MDCAAVSQRTVLSSGKTSPSCSMAPIGQARKSRRGCWTSSGYGACEQPCAVVVYEDGSCDAADVRRHALSDGFRQLVFQCNITDGNPASWPQNARDLAEDSRLIRCKIHDAVRDD